MSSCRALAAAITAALLLSACAWWPAPSPARTSVSLSDAAGPPRPAWLRDMVAAMDAAAAGAPIRLKLSYELRPPAAPALAQALAQAATPGRL